MTRYVLFIQGAGKGAHEEDKILAESLRRSLGAEHEVHYPEMPDEDDAPYEEWKRRIEDEFAAMTGPVVLVGHSVGASVLLKWLSEGQVEKPISAVFLIAAPFWGGHGWRYEGYEELTLPESIRAVLPKDARIAFYHSRDDEIVPFAHMKLYEKLFPHATIRTLSEGGHQLNNDLSMVAQDIKSL